MPKRKKPPLKNGSRNPDRSRERILTAALREFSLRGFAGARVDVIARGARINKRMLYHYFGDKQGLFRAVIRQKISERMANVEQQSPGSDFASTMPLWFLQNTKGVEWMRLLAWESLQTSSGKICDEEARREAVLAALADIKRKQKEKTLRSDVPAEFLQLAKASLVTFPLVMPHLARIILGHPVSDRRFQQQYAKFLETISAAFRP
jgi:AcrR family transcriptional regulator